MVRFRALMRVLPLPASLLRLELSPDHELSAGIASTVFAKWAGGRAYEPTGWEGEPGTIRVVGKWATDPADVLAAGQLVGAELLAGKGAVLDVGYGDDARRHRGSLHKCDRPPALGGIEPTTLW